MEQKKRWTKKKIILAAVLVLLAVAVPVAVLIVRRQSTPKEEVPQQVYEGMQNNYYVGVIEAGDTWSITKDAEKEISEVMVAAGDSVTTGQVLFTYDTADTASQLEAAKIEMESMQNDVADYNNQAAELQQQLNGASEEMRLELNAQLSQLNVSIKQAQLSIKTKEVEINRLAQELEHATVTSKMDGVVQSVGGEEAYMVILATGEYHVKGTVDELNVSSLYEGQAVIVHSRVNEETWKGTITKIENSTAPSQSDYVEESGDNQASKYYFYVALENSEHLRMGQHVYIEPSESEGGEEMP